MGAPPQIEDLEKALYKVSELVRWAKEERKKGKPGGAVH